MTQPVMWSPRSTPEAGAADQRPATRRRRSPLSQAASSRLLWAAPALVFLVVFFVYPLWLLVDTSLREVSLGTAAASDNPFVGLENYAALAGDDDFLRAVPRTVVFLLGTVALQLVLGMALALALSSRLRGLSVPRFIVYFVWLLPPVVSGAIWKFALDGTAQGAVNAALLALGVVETPILFLTTPWLAMVLIGFVNAWAGVPFVAIIMTAALKDVPEDHYEAARVDGASPLQRFRHITLPTVWPTVGILSALLVIYSFKAFDFIFVLTQGGPGTSTSTVPFLAYLVSFVQFDFGRGSAIGMVAVAFSLLFAMPYIVSTWKERRS